jgi:hypothetical protein
MQIYYFISLKEISLAGKIILKCKYSEAVNRTEIEECRILECYGLWLLLRAYFSEERRNFFAAFFGP